MIKHTYTEERALFRADGVSLKDCVFSEGESPLKESKNVALDGCAFTWKYPVWYSENVTMTGCTLHEMARAGIWYTRNITLRDSLIIAPKTFRRAENITLERVQMPHADETLWRCKGVTMKAVSAKGDYFAMNSSDMQIEDFELEGNYSFDGAKNVVIRNARLNSKDAFWNSENVTVIDSFISGEYLGWNAKNLTLINCTVESLQGMCYIENLVMKNCKTPNTILAFEYSTVDVETDGIGSVFNPAGGKIVARKIGELIFDEKEVDPAATQIVCEDIGKHTDPETALKQLRSLSA